MNTSSMENLQCKSIVLVVNSSNFYTAEWEGFGRASIIYVPDHRLFLVHTETTRVNDMS